jgi:hypothetical protein
LQGCKNLRKVELLEAKITEEGLFPLAQGCPLLSIFNSPLRVSYGKYKLAKQFCPSLSASVVTEAQLEMNEDDLFVSGEIGNKYGVTYK